VLVLVGRNARPCSNQERCSIGDGHAAQDDGEIMGTAIETSFDVQFTVEFIKRKEIDWLRLENDRYIMSIAGDGFSPPGHSARRLFPIRALKAQAPRIL
jgi:hypothetical protein